VERKLAAILAADVVGYSKLMAENEEQTLTFLREHRAGIFDPKVAEHGGRIIKLMGDGTLVEFGSVVDAVNCAVAIQSELGKTEGPIRLRIGINLGDVIVEGDDIYGDGVNVAARLEGIAEPGGICVSDLVRQSIRQRNDAAFEDLGEQRLKNLDQPVRAWRWTGAATDAQETTPRIAAAISDRPSIAVLPFDNMSGDPDQDYFADGMVEDIITALSRLSWLFVIARNSSFTYKGPAVDVKRVGRELGVRYVLEGSVRKAGNRLRITGQLIDAANGTHLWADRYDGNIEDIFDLQDQVTSSVVGAIAPKLERAEIERSRQKPTNSLDAYDVYLRGMAAFYQWNADGNAEALKLFYRAIEIDQDYASAYAMAARCLNTQGVIDPKVLGAPEHVAEAERMSRRAAELGRDDAMALSMAGVTLGFTVKDIRGGAALTERALVLNPNLAWAHYCDGWLQAWLGRGELAIERVDRAIQLSPQDPTIFQLQSALAFAHFTAGNYDTALSWAERALHDRPSHFPALMVAVASAGHLDRQAEAKEFSDRILRLFPYMELRLLSTLIPYSNAEDAERLTQGYRLAGFSG
jgi:adenylate cyclase